MSKRKSAADVRGTIDRERRRLWGIAYRLTGSAADAEDIAQESLARWMEHAPDLDLGSRERWLVRVATNLGVDALRARRKRAYPGPWLPEPTEYDDEGDWIERLEGKECDPEARYGAAESATLAFLAALEVLSPRQRAALLLRDLLGYSASETAAVLSTTEGSVRVLHLRARRAMEAYERDRRAPTHETSARHRAVLERFLACLHAQDTRALESLLTDSVRAVTDAGGEYTALRAPLSGRAEVARFYVRAALHRAAGGPTVEIRSLNGVPAAVVRLARPVRRQAPLTVLSLDVDASGSVRGIFTILASRKLARLGISSQPARNVSSLSPS